MKIEGAGSRVGVTRRVFCSRACMKLKQLNGHSDYIQQNLLTLPETSENCGHGDNLAKNQRIGPKTLTFIKSEHFLMIRLISCDDSL